MSLTQFPDLTKAPLCALAFDYGTQRIGVAFGQSISGTAQAVTVLKANDGIPNWDEIGALIEQWRPDIFVVGLPYNMDGSDSDLLRRATKFANRLNGRFNLPSYGMDERLTSREARSQVAEANDHALKGTKKRAADDQAIDHIAAQIILENWFSAWRESV